MKFVGPWTVHGCTVYGRLVKSCSYCSCTVHEQYCLLGEKAWKKKKRRENATNMDPNYALIRTFHASIFFWRCYVAFFIWCCHVSCTRVIFMWVVVTQRLDICGLILFFDCPPLTCHQLEINLIMINQMVVSAS